MIESTHGTPATAPSAADLVVFSHGNSFPASTYRVMLDALRARGFAVAAVDKYGHDARYPVTNNWPHLVEQLRDFAAREVQAAGAKAWLVGHSLGGYLSLMCAALHPDVARGVVLMDSPIVTGWRANALHMAKRTQIVGSVSPGKTSRKRRQSWPGRDAAHEHFRQKKAFAGWHPKVLDDYIDHGTLDDERGERVLAFDREIETTIYNTLPHNLEALLKRHPLKVPLTFIGGTRSAEIRQAGLAATQKVAHGRITMLGGTHHFPMEKPDVAAAAVALAVMEMASAVGGDGRSP
jgi:pimeloyl-ACP methyl ester carboxylesterase